MRWLGSRSHDRATTPTVPTVPVVAVLGLYRGGSSCTAGVLHHLGLHLGAKLMKADRRNPRGYFEPVWLARQLRRIYDEPRLRKRWPRDHRVATLRQWYQTQAPIAQGRGTWLAVKHPLLCVAGDDLIDAWGEALRLVAVYRPLEDCLASLDRIGWWRKRHRRPLLTALWQQREALLARQPHVRIDYHELLTNPELQIRRLVDHLRLPTTDEAIAAASAFVDPRLRNVERSTGR